MTMSKGLHILLIEDEVSIAKNIAQYMEHKGHVLDFAVRGDQGLDLALNAYYDVVILDLNLPSMDGLNVCQTIREKSERHVPILMLTARDSIDDKVSGFHVGTDDYLTKPFSLQELEVRCIALSKRHLLQTTDKIELGPLTIDRKSKTASRDGQSLSLSSMGFRILQILAEAHPQVVSRSQLTQQLWGDEPTESDALRSHIYQLRNVVDKPFSSPLIKTVFGAGFALSVDDNNAV
ncbi:MULTISPECIES: response regulator transcription factor [unclassified Alteromonas]|uniref:response regulator transcription factor n=1 Tax=unclassified Alteromonas TaxID=2614992 RepID=UPI0019250510|nr:MULTISPECIES: response regulator transcription factor [unclassified Alteromonas]WDT84738.1 response regulator transcription factor [Alteromonas sp. 009811495]BCO19614.1 DNA-binding response regulator [Alteromonas sp. KC3]BCO23579.1 DNA-binding response regulator [Alteromonas sp. KC14]